VNVLGEKEKYIRGSLKLNRRHIGQTARPRAVKACDSNAGGKGGRGKSFEHMPVDL